MFALLGLDGSCGFPLAILVVFELCFLFGFVRCVVGPVLGSHSKCAGLTQSNETVSTLPFIRIFIIHVCMFLFPCTGKCLSGVCHVADINGDATWLRVHSFSVVYCLRPYTETTHLKLCPGNTPPLTDLIFSCRLTHIRQPIRERLAGQRFVNKPR